MKQNERVESDGTLDLDEEEKNGQDYDLIPSFGSENEEEE